MLTQLLFLALSATAFARPSKPDPVGAQETIAFDLCPADLRHFLLPHEYDCAKFYYCEYGEKWVTPRDCAPGTHFSFEIQVCVHPIQAGCTLPGVPTEAPETEATTSGPSSTIAGIVSSPQTTEAPETEAPETETPETEATTAAASSTIAGIASSPHTTKTPETEAPETEAPETEAPETEAPETEAPQTETPETEATTSAASSTIAGIASSPHTTKAPETEAPETEAPETEAPETEVPETEATTSAASSTIAGIASSPHTTKAPETEAPETEAPKTEAPETEAPETEAPETEAPETEAPETEAPETEAPVTEAPETDAPETETPETEAPETETPETEAPETEAPQTEATTSVASSTIAGIASSPHTTAKPETESTTSAPSSTEASINSSPHTTKAPETEATDAPSTASPGGVTAPEGTEWLENGCPVSWEIHWLLPHEECNKFYYCNFGEKVERTCPQSTYFNPVLQVCDHAWNVECAGAGSEDNGTDGEDEGTDEEDSDDSADDGKGQWLDNGCPADWNVHWLLPHEADCGKFYYCVHGQKVERECAEPLHFNPTLQVCDWAANAGCSLNGGNEDNNEENSVEEDNNTNTESNEVEFLDNGCPADWNVHWLLPHESDCGKFHYCVHGEKVERECREPLHFNPTLQVCDWAENAGCAVGDNNGGENDNDSNNSVEDGDDNEDDSNNGNGSGEDNNEDNTEEENGEWLDNGCPADLNVHWLLPHESDCGKFYYCVHGNKVERECREPLHFNPTLQVCDWAGNAGCAVGDNNGEEDDNNSNNSVEDGDDNEDDSNNGNGSGEEDNNEDNTEEENGEWLDNGCPADLNVHWLLPHESDCGKFYYCVHGNKVERECREPLHFNPTLQVCDWTENAGCAVSDNNGDEDDNNNNNSVEDGNDNEDDSNNGSGSGEEDNNEDNNEEEGGEWLDNGCPADLSIHWLLPHESDCGKFYYCVHGQKVERECREPLHFNPTLQVCDWAENAGCALGDNNGGEDDNNNNNSVEDGDDNEEDNNGNGSGEEDNNEDNTEEENGEWLDNGCPADLNVHWLLPHESDCGKFYYCVHGNKVERECHEPLHFNPILQVCDWTENAGCASNGNNSGNSDEDGNNGGNSEEDSAIGGNSEEDNTIIAPEEEPDNSKCVSNCNILPWAHRTACDKYWRCEGEEAVLVICSEGLHFNAKTGTCDFICNANCVRENVQSTADQQGLKIFVPWDKVRKGMRYY